MTLRLAAKSGELAIRFQKATQKAAATRSLRLASNATKSLPAAKYHDDWFKASHERESVAAYITIHWHVLTI
jgi:hypothetical protein